MAHKTRTRVDWRTELGGPKMAHATRGRDAGSGGKIERRGDAEGGARLFSETTWTSTKQKEDGALARSSLEGGLTKRLAPEPSTSSVATCDGNQRRWKAAGGATRGGTQLWWEATAAFKHCDILCAQLRREAAAVGSNGGIQTLRHHLWPAAVGSSAGSSAAPMNARGEVRAEATLRRGEIAARCAGVVACRCEARIGSFSALFCNSISAYRQLLELPSGGERSGGGR